jgi:hypothetical protein
MKRIYSSQSHMVVALLKNILEASGISCVIRNELLAGAAGELPPIECWPELWVMDDNQYEWARKLIKTTLDAGDHGRSVWQCRQCGECLEGQFAQCWSCGQVRESGQ